MVGHQMNTVGVSIHGVHNIFHNTVWLSNSAGKQENTKKRLSYPSTVIGGLFDNDAKKYDPKRDICMHLV